MSFAAAERPAALLRQRFPGRRDLYLLERAESVEWVRAPLTDDVLLRHVRGEGRIGVAANGSATFGLIDLDGKPKRGTTDPAPAETMARLWERVRRLYAVLDADLGIVPLIEVSRSGRGLHIWVLANPVDAPTVEEMRSLLKAALRAVGLPDDGDESKGHPGIFPHPAGVKGIGRTGFLPWAGLLSGATGALFVGIADGTPLERQETALEDARLVSRRQVMLATATLLDAESERGEIEAPAEWIERGAEPPRRGMFSLPHEEGITRHGDLRAEIMRLRSFLPIEETRPIAFALARSWGMGPDRDGEIESLITGAYLKPALKVSTQYDREAGREHPVPAPRNLYSPEIVPARPEFTVASLIRRAGVHLVWAEPSGGKTWTLLRWLHELSLRERPSKLTGVPELWLNRSYSRSLWIATEEDAGTLRHKAEMIWSGLGVPEMAGTIDYLFAASADRRVTLDDLPELFEKHGPYDAVILDSLTGLRPKTVNGERIRWDVDNDAANEIGLRLRGLATKYGTALVLLHHTGRDTGKGYRGPTDWWASADVMLGFVPDGGRTKVLVEKNRDGKRIAPFYLTPTWTADTYTLEYDGAASPVRLTPTADKVLAFVRGRGQASQVEILDNVRCARSTGLDAIRALEAAGEIRNTGNKVDRSPIYAATEQDGEENKRGST